MAKSQKVSVVGSAVDPVAEPDVDRGVVMSVKALENTWLKKKIASASELTESEKVAVALGKTYGVVSYGEIPEQVHVEVELGGRSGIWYIYEPHWIKISGAALVNDEIDWTNFASLVTPHLSVGEVLQWDVKRTPPANSSDRRRLVETAREFEKIRVAWGGPLGVTSFYRPEPINTQVGGVPGSRHTTGEAVDLYPVGRTLDALYDWLRVRWTGGLGDGRNRGFLHIDTRGGGSFVPGAGVRPIAEWLY